MSRVKSSQASIGHCEHFLFLLFFLVLSIFGVLFFGRRYPGTESTLMKKCDLPTFPPLHHQGTILRVFRDMRKLGKDLSIILARRLELSTCHPCCSVARGRVKSPLARCKAWSLAMPLNETVHEVYISF